MMHPDLGGLYKTPVTYAYMSATGLMSAAAIFFDRPNEMHLDLRKIGKQSQYWRLLTSHFGFGDGVAVAFGIYLIFSCRVLERQFGSKKFGSFVVLVMTLSSLLQIGLLKFKFVKSIASGPYALIGALMVLYFGNVPKLQPHFVRAMGIAFSDKSPTYFMMCLVCFRGIDTITPFLTGVLVGLLYQTKSLPLHKFRLPSFLCWFFEIFHPIFMVVPAAAAVQQRQRQLQEMQRRAAAMGQPNGQGFREQLIPGMGGGMPIPVAPPSEAAIEQLTALGFEREQAIAALRTADNNVEAAANRLLNGM
ncbi:hypothetical protein THRCLA_01258 [Thraustotheca clavata]|uniref:UBA domain-containing protein n=1 Tax=Thraustotheca clavata TaxID=74557 RepID=A0A1W0A914_9STRA|nr:hypothetical protein THRCLA_01258 [Thraustotheca clavata]